MYFSDDSMLEAIPQDTQPLKMKMLSGDSNNAHSGLALWCRMPDAHARADNHSFSWVEIFMTAESTTKIMKISTPLRNYPQYDISHHKQGVNPRRMHSEDYSSLTVGLCVCLSTLCSPRGRFTCSFKILCMFYTVGWVLSASIY